MAYILRSENLQDRMLTYGDNVYTYTLNGSLLTKTRTLSGVETPLVTEYSYDAMGSFRLRSQSRDMPETSVAAMFLSILLEVGLNIG